MARKSESEHNKMIRALVGHLEQEKFIDIKADHIGGDQPDQINWKGGGGHIPDVKAKKGGVTYLFEVETDDSINDDHTADQLRLFSKAAESWDNHAFNVLVPKDSKEELEAVLTELDITNAGVWTI